MIVASRLEPIQLESLSEMPKVSVLISNYNYGGYIGEAIESVLAQTYENFELIICDDGSTDNSMEMIDNYRQRDSRVHAIAKSNGGQASGFNTAFLASTGELICFLDSDDVFRPTKVACMVDAHRNAPSAGFGIHRIQRTNRRRRPQGVWPLASVLPQGWKGEQMLNEGGVLSYMPPTSGLTLRRGVAELIFPLPETYPLTSVADQVITRFAPLLTAVVHSAEVLAEYRLHGANGYGRSKTTSGSILKEIATCNHLWQAQRDFLENLDPDLASQLKSIENSSYLIYLQYLYARLSQSRGQEESHRRYMLDIASNPQARLVWFWKYSIYLPSSIFGVLVNFMSQQSLLKEIIARFRGVTHR